MIVLNSFLYNTSSFLICIVLLIAIIIFYMFGTRLADIQRRLSPGSKADGIGALEGSLMGLLALLLSFTFSMSASRYDSRRSTIIQEANAIGTATLRADMYPDSARIEFRKDFRSYLEARIAYFDAGNDQSRISQSIKDANIISARIWQRATLLSRQSTTTIPHSLMIPALNDMLDAATSRDAARLARVPDPIMWLLIILTILESMVIGYSKKEKKNDWIILSLYSLMTVVTIFTIMDLDRPRRGIIRTENANQKMVELREMFNATEK